MLEEKTSKHLGIPYIYLPEQKKYLCQNGVMFTLEEYKAGIDLNAEYERREREDKLYDYAYAKSTGLLRKKRGTAKTEDSEKRELTDSSEVPTRLQTIPTSESREEVVSFRGDSTNSIESRGSGIYTDKYTEGKRENRNGVGSIKVICALLAFTSVISMYISTLHTATYLKDYADLISAWLMSASVTAYNATAFEVSVLFHTSKRNFMATIFMLLWILVTLFSMTTTVSVFYDQFNFQETQIAEENKQVDSNKLALELLQKKEADLREAIEFKKKDIEYRQEHEYATTAVRTELNQLQTELQSNLTEQENLLKETPEVTEEKIQRKESMFSFLGRLLHLEGGILEFIMSTLSAVFVNLIAPLSLTAVTELLKKSKSDID